VPRVYRQLALAMVGSEVGTDRAGSNVVAIDHFRWAIGVHAVGGATSTRAGGTDGAAVNSDRWAPFT
jgi:hypothetical protein